MEVEEEREIIHAIYQIDPTVHEDEVIKAVQKCRIDLLEAVKRELGLPA
jgi:flagellar biosynthesis regulator FlbT